ncbi:unnamed protein product [Dracunculus medinensis]|uniref:CCHC-type domain-containing protein n=1 Tax=Dracunculus medinensis TaxID=318479 RepID=A0A0N4U3H7_DRAME|nr:unnamed protein product [Dracunculus medinensis]
MKNSIILLDFKQLERNASVVSNSNNVQQKFLVWLTVHVVNGRLERDTCFGENYNDVACDTRNEANPKQLEAGQLPRIGYIPLAYRKARNLAVDAVLVPGLNWKTVVETIERILPQLEAVGENLEHWNTDSDETWSVIKLRQFLGKLIKRNDQVTKSQAPMIVIIREDLVRFVTKIIGIVIETYPTLKQRLERLIKIKACRKCLKGGHIEANCK